MTYVLGIHEGLNATACLIGDGEIIGCASEERFSRRKNHTGIPFRAIDYCMDAAGISIKDVALTVFTTSVMPAFRAGDAAEGGGASLFSFLRRLEAGVLRCSHNRLVKKLHTSLYDRMALSLGKKIVEDRAHFFSERFSCSRDRIVSIDHHLCHALSALYSFPRSANGCLVVTLDGEGDLLSGTVSVLSGGSLRRTSSQHIADSLGWFYMTVTQYLGMKPHEHEYKVMGMAPYAEEDGIDRALKKIGRPFVVDREGRIVAKFHMRGCYDYLRRRLEAVRFDYIAGAAQKITEELLVEYFTSNMDKAGIRDLYIGGGVFMNVKANMRVLNDIPTMGKFYPMPSCGDESTAIGAAYHGYLTVAGNAGRPIQPLKNIYLGPSFGDQAVQASLKKHGCHEKYVVEKCDDIDSRVAELLANNKIVARLKGRMEFGARALGNRSILANPSNTDLVFVLNKQIKCRDFWMPFAGTVLRERVGDYLTGRTDIESPFMMIAFATTDMGKKHFKAAVHPYDKTMRPQILRQDDNPSYYNLIKHFERLTGIGGVLNTSFNLHGDPMVCSPDDALYTFEASGLEYLALEDYLVSKKVS